MLIIFYVVSNKPISITSPVFCDFAITILPLSLGNAATTTKLYIHIEKKKKEKKN